MTALAFSFGICSDPYARTNPAEADGIKCLAGIMKATKELCGDVFNQNVCTKEKEHRGKHSDDREGFGYTMWTDGGKQRELAEQAEQARRAEIEREPF